MNAVTFPPRYYSHLIDVGEVESILEQISNPLECIQLLDVVSLHTLLQSLPKIEQQHQLLEMYDEHFTSAQLLTVLPQSNVIEPLLREQLERTVASLVL